MLVADMEYVAGDVLPDTDYIVIYNPILSSGMYKYKFSSGEIVNTTYAGRGKGKILLYLGKLVAKFENSDGTQDWVPIEYLEFDEAFSVLNKQLIPTGI